MIPRTVTRAIVLVGVLILVLSACSGPVRVSSKAICEAAGGTYSSATCTQSSPSQRTARQMCETQGGVYLAGEDVCAFGGGLK